MFATHNAARIIIELLKIHALVRLRYRTLKLRATCGCCASLRRSCGAFARKQQVSIVQRGIDPK
jgi:hypothetical protein